ncbi:hypothetical protein GCM10009613_16170 [Pseudonocardia kongjuensis]|uniref:Uncharacterized protein n=1 Tax=Pseudonocardia kongjuensis TaxID=102227 RepID=A0ABP4IF24_9PSEU
MPSAAGSPTAANPATAAASRGPQPPTFSGTVIATIASTSSGSSSAVPATDPAARAARTNITR